MSKYSAKLATEECVAIKNTAEGETIAVSDSADAKLRGLKVMGKTEQFTTTGKNILPYPYHETRVTINGITFTDHGDCSVSAVGTATANVSFYLMRNTTLPSGTYTLFGGVSGSIARADGTTTFITTNANTFTLEDGDTLNYIAISVLAEVTVNQTYYPMLCKGSVTDGTWEPFTGGVPAPNVNYPQPLESIGDDGSVAISAHRYQLFDADKIPSAKIRGVTLTNNGDGSFSFSGTPTKAGQSVYTLSHAETVALLKAGHIMLTDYFGNTSTNPYVYMKLSYNNEANSVEINMSKANMATIEITQDMLDDESCYAVFGIYISTKRDITNTTIKPMIYQDGDGIWEPSTPSILTISTPNGLPGVPVSSDGNYTDASGQQWACDEVDFDREVYVQRVAEYVVTGNENWVVSTYQNSTDGRIRFDSAFVGLPAKATGDRCLCTHSVFNGISPRNVESVWVASNGLRILTNCFSTVDELKIALKAQYDAGTPVTFKYPIATPIEKPLSADEINAYKALQTYKPNTSIHNSENAHMAVDYVADTKNYIDNKINKAVAELSAAILTQ